MLNRKDGSIFLLTLTCMSVLFILGFSITFFTGSEDYASAMSYESEVAFNLAESAIEEFVARLKNSLNNDEGNNQLYSVLRHPNLDLSKPIPLEPAQVARLTAYTRETARQIYGIQFGRGLVDSKEFVVKASIKLQHINGVEAANGDQVLYALHKDTREKQGELEVNADVTYRGHTAKISLKFLIRVVKTFVPPFNYFTLYVKEASPTGLDPFGNEDPRLGSNFNVSSSGGEQADFLRLDNGWDALRDKFDATHPSNLDFWEQVLAATGPNASVPPGRVFLGQNPATLQRSPAIFLRSTNGSKILYDQSINYNGLTQINGQENFFLPFDIPWMGMKDFVKNYMDLQGEGGKVKEGWLFTGWGNDHKIRLLNVGATKSLLDDTDPFSFINCFTSFDRFTKNIVGDPLGNPVAARFYPPLDLSGLKVFGHAPPVEALHPGNRADFKQLSPTIVYGPAQRQYFVSFQVRPKDGESLVLPFVDIRDKVENTKVLETMPGVDLKTELNATQAMQLFLNAGVLAEHAEKMSNNWDKLPDGLKRLDKYAKFMSNSASELYNKGLTNFVVKLRNQSAKYSGPLEPFLGGYMDNYPYSYGPIPAGIRDVVSKNQSFMTECYEGPLWQALPESHSSYLLDFYFIPRSTEDFFRGRTTVAVGGVSYDRFEFKYINNVQAYRSGANNQTLELNGVLALNDSEPLGLRNLKFRGHGIIYSSPMMGGGKVVISGDLLGDGTDVGALSNPGNHLLTIIAPQIVIDTTAAQGGRCYVEANLISVSEPLLVQGEKPVTIKGSVATPYMQLDRHMPKGENVIMFNSLNGSWRGGDEKVRNKMYVAKIVTGGVGKFDWKYER